MSGYLKFNLIVRCCSNSIQNNLEIRGSSCSCGASSPVLPSKQKVVPGAVLRHGCDCVLHWFILCLDVSVYALGKNRHRDVVDL